MATVIYALCALTSLACAGLLLRSYLANRVPLLLWAGLCFAGLTLNNIFLFIDFRVVPEMDLQVWRSIPSLVGLSLLLYGLVWETR